ncbi:hypothetical protein EON63_02925 [archaeon]|nr:MAG: hypothetical protein EON63_02925 [archaeon]
MMSNLYGVWYMMYVVWCMASGVWRVVYSLCLAFFCIIFPRKAMSIVMFTFIHSLTAIGYSRVLGQA